MQRDTGDKTPSIEAEVVEKLNSRGHCYMFLCFSFLHFLQKRKPRPLSAVTHPLGQICRWASVGAEGISAMTALREALNSTFELKCVKYSSSDLLQLMIVFKINLIN